MTAVSIVPDVLWAGLFFFALWLFGRVFDLLKTGMIGQIIVGVLFQSVGMKLLRGEEALSILGQIGLMFLVFEGGLALELRSLRNVALRGFLLSTLGAVLPIFAGYLFFYLFRQASILESLAGGASLASSSIAVALVVMNAYGLLVTKTGVLITTAAMMDDIISLVLLALVTSLTKLQQPASDATNEEIAPASFAWAIAQPLVFSVVIMVVGTIAAVAIPKALTHASRRFGFLNNDKVLLGIMLAYGYLFSISAAYSGASNLMGAFFAGLAFSTIDRGKQTWKAHVSAIQVWLASMFFASIGFLVPVTELFEGWSVLWGLLWTVISIVAKLATGFLGYSIKEDFWIVGFAMVGRGELGLVMAAQSLNDGVMSQQTFAICIWAIVLCTFVSPLVLGLLLRLRKKRDGLVRSGKSSSSSSQEVEPPAIVQVDDIEDSSAKGGKLADAESRHDEAKAQRRNSELSLSSSHDRHSHETAAASNSSLQPGTAAGDVIVDV